MSGRLSTTELATKVGLTVAPTHRRVRSRAVRGHRRLPRPH
ncbi:winged helix-turn-helix transcriptional regulator [Mycolicibacterium baixiangningiae]|nr:winged helix-turn-helix transcriptional regulator [Mycolicibacterium baixiangningiae]